MTPRQAKLFLAGVVLFSYLSVRTARRQDQIVKINEAMYTCISSIQEYMALDYQLAVDEQFDNIVGEEFPGGLDG